MRPGALARRGTAGTSRSGPVVPVARRLGLLFRAFARLGRRAAPRPLASDRVLRGLTITGGEDEEKRRRLPEVSARAAKPPHPSADVRVFPGRHRTGSAADFTGPGLGAGLSAGRRQGRLLCAWRGAGLAPPRIMSIAKMRFLETQDGVELKGRAAINGEVTEWAKDFEPRKESQDVAAVRFQVIGLKDTPPTARPLKMRSSAAFAGHRYAYRIDALEDGAIEARAVVAFAGTTRRRRGGHARALLCHAERQVGAAEGFAERVFAPKVRSANEGPYRGGDRPRSASASASSPARPAMARRASSIG